MKNIKKMQILIGILLLILGMLISLQIKSIRQENNLTNRQKDLDQLQELLVQEQERTLALENLLAESDTKLKGYEKKFIQQNKNNTIKKQLDYARTIAGLTEVKGPGIEITLDDSQIRITDGIDPSDTVIHDGQLIEIMNMLKGAGAEAISLNDERIVSTSETQCAGPTVSVNQTRYAVPFVIKAIGDADYLEATLKEPGSILDLMKIFGIQINIKKQSEVVIPKYKELQKDNVSYITSFGG